MKTPVHLALFVAVSFVPNLAFGCQCAEPTKSFRAAATRAENVFVGRAVVTKTRNAQGMADWPVQTVRFDVEHVWRGEVAEQVVLETGLSSCDFYFESGRTYVVFLSHGVDSRLQAHECDPTGVVNSAAVVSGELGLPSKPKSLSFLQKLRLWWLAL